MYARRIAALILFILTPTLASADPVIHESELSATGRQEVVFAVEAFGRYAVTVDSDQGTAVQLIDPMAGPGRIAGHAGTMDGRLDVFLDRGEYKIITHGHPMGSGTAKVRVHAFTERNGEAPPLLIELKDIEDTLHDFEQYSYWLHIESRKTVMLEAAGRNLADMRLWQDGLWLMDATPAHAVEEPVEGQPLRACRLSYTLEPGLYQLVLYGGTPQPWAEDDGGAPFYLRYGVPALSEAGRQHFEVGPIGVDRWIVPGMADLFRMELPEAMPVSMRVKEFSPMDVFVENGSHKAIQKNSVPPVATIHRSSRHDGSWVVTVRGEAGQSYVLQHFHRRSTWNIDEQGEFWLSTVHTGHPSDSVDATGILSRKRKHSDDPRVLVETDLVELDSRNGWTRRCNLMAPVKVLVDIQDKGKYRVQVDGLDAEARFEPFLTSYPREYEAPHFQLPGYKWKLDEGLHVLTVQSDHQGVVDISVLPGGLANLFRDPLAGAPLGVDAAVQIPRISLSKTYHYTVHLGRQPEVSTGLILRRLPMDLRDPLPIALQPDETVEVEFRASEKVALQATLTDGTVLALSVDGGTWSMAPEVTAGTYKVTVRNGGDDTGICSLRAMPVRLQRHVPLPPLPDATRALLPDFTRLTETKPHYMDLERNRRETFLVEVDTPTLYRLESTGLLATAGTVRTRTILSLDSSNQNGIGRNFLFQRYLRNGIYQLNVETQGLTKGHLGLTLTRTPLEVGGKLGDSPARATLRPGHALVYFFTIEEAGHYHLRATGLGRSFRCRLEDGDGWPIETPGIPAELNRHFEAGDYRIVVLPETVTARVVTTLERRADPLHFEGHGPHELPLAQAVNHLWNESPEGAARIPDTWDFELPAGADVAIDLSDKMVGELHALVDGAEPSRVAPVPMGEGWRGPLAAGRYRLEVTSTLRDNQVPYSVYVNPEQLLAGMRRQVQAPATLWLAAGEDSLVELSSLGGSDVRARLYDADGKLVLANDDRPHDWNFHLARHLTAGRYRLRVDPVGSGYATCDVAMLVPQEERAQALKLPGKRKVVPSDKVVVIPLTVPDRTEFVVVAGLSRDSLGMSLEASVDGDWQTMGTAVGPSVHLEAPLPGGGAGQVELRLRVWSADRRGGTIRLSTAAVPRQRISESRLRSGATLSALNGVDIPIGVAAVSLDRPGVFRLQGSGEGIRWSATGGAACVDAEEGVLEATGDVLWLSADLSERRRWTTRASRVELPSAQDGITLEMAQGAPMVECDLADAAGGPVLAMVTSRTGQPGLHVTEKSDVPRATPTGMGLAVGRRAAVAVSLAARQPVALLWPAEETDGPQEVYLRSWAFDTPRAEKAEWGALAGALAAGSVRRLDLPAGDKQIRLALDDQTVAVLASRTGLGSVHWGDGEPLDETMNTAAEHLVLLHTGEGGRFAAEILPAGDGALDALIVGQPYEQLSNRTGALRLAIGPTRGELQPGATRLHVRGAEGDATLITPDGRVLRGTDLPAPDDGGTLLLKHGPGLLLAWLDQPGMETAGLWGQRAMPKPTAIEPPATVRLEGEVTSLWMEPQPATMLHVRAPVPAATLLWQGDDDPTVELHPDGCSLDAVLEGELTFLVLRPVGGAAALGQATVTTTAVEPIGEGLGPEVLLAAGSTRAFSFDVTRAGNIGFGVRADSDRVQATLLDAAGRRIDSGLVRMVALEPGSYILALHAPEDGPPVSARPALAGVEPPETGPPDEVLRQYLSLAGFTQPAAPMEE